MVYRFITKETFEEKINEIIKNKKEISDLVVSSGEKWIGEFSDTELKNFFSITN